MTTSGLLFLGRKFFWKRSALIAVSVHQQLPLQVRLLLSHSPAFRRGVHNFLIKISTPLSDSDGMVRFD